MTKSHVLMTAALLFGQVAFCLGADARVVLRGQGVNAPAIGAAEISVVKEGRMRRVLEVLEALDSRVRTSGGIRLRIKGKVEQHGSVGRSVNFAAGQGAKACYEIGAIGGRGC